MRISYARRVHCMAKGTNQQKAVKKKKQVKVIV